MTACRNWPAGLGREGLSRPADQGLIMHVMLSLVVLWQGTRQENVDRVGLRELASD